jgi:hypothetical protein
MLVAESDCSPGAPAVRDLRGWSLRRIARRREGLADRGRDRIPTDWNAGEQPLLVNGGSLSHDIVRWFVLP